MTGWFGPPPHMNKSRRSEIARALDILNAVRDEEQTAYDNMPDSLRDGEKGDKMQEGLDQIEEAISALEEVINS